MFTSSIIRDAIRGYCSAHGLTYKEFAVRAGVRENTIRCIVSGEEVPEVEEMRRIAAKAMHCTLTQLLEKGA